MKAILLFLSLLGFAGALPAYAQQNSNFPNCLRAPNPSTQSLDWGRAALAENKVAVYYVVPFDAAFEQAEYDAIRKASRELQAWFQLNTGGVTYSFSSPDTVIFYQALENTGYYQEDWWGRLLPEMRSQGIPVWEAGTVLSLWIKTGQSHGIGLGAQWCDGNCGVAMAGVENFPEFNNHGVCPSDGNMWPCVPHATMAHELGHAFGLPHPVEVESTQEVANHSVMQTHWNYPNNPLDPETPWGLLTTERTSLWENPFFQENIDLRQLYDSDIVNLPATGPVPETGISSHVTEKTVTLTNNTTDAQLYYWTFGDGAVSNDKSPSHTYSQPGTYTIALRASGGTGMTAMQQLTVEVTDPTKPVQKPISLGPLKIFPNPSVDGRFTVVYPPFPFAIRFTLPFLRLTVLNSLGKVLATHTVSSVLESQQLDLSNYGRGIYYVRLELKGASLTQKLVIL